MFRDQKSLTCFFFFHKLSPPCFFPSRVQNVPIPKQELLSRRVMATLAPWSSASWVREAHCRQGHSIPDMEKTRGDKEVGTQAALLLAGLRGAKLCL